MATSTTREAHPQLRRRARAALPLPVLERVQAELLDYAGTGMSVLEMSHRSEAFEGIIQSAEADLRSLLGLGADHAVLFLQGGASLQFAMVPANLRPRAPRPTTC